jgi:hypothetical protein
MTRFFTLLLSLLTVSIICFAQSPSREDLQQQIEAKRYELKTLEQQFLEPSAEDKATYAAYLGHKDMGLFRLLPRKNWDENAMKAAELLSLRGGGSFYSFTKQSHDYNSLPDIALERGELLVGFAGANYGMMTNLGEVPLESISLEEPHATFLASYQVPSVEPKARTEARRFSAGSTEDGSLYKARMKAEVRSTYLLRSINFSGSDVLVALRIMRKDSDGSVIIVWKLLKNYPIPQLARNE